MIRGEVFTLSAWRALGTEVSPEDTALCCPLQARRGRTDIVTYRVSHNKVYLLNIPISQPPNIVQSLFSTRNLCLDITFQKNYVFMF